MSGDHQEEHLTIADNRHVLFCLMCLTIVTVLIADFDLGSWNLPVAMLVAAVKCTFVFTYFMHLKFDTNINRFIFGSGFFFLALFFGFTALDVFTRV